MHRVLVYLIAQIPCIFNDICTFLCLRIDIEQHIIYDLLYEMMRVEYDEVLHGGSCPACKKSGYYGRVSLFKLMELASEWRRKLKEFSKYGIGRAECENQKTHMPAFECLTQKSRPLRCA